MRNYFFVAFLLIGFMGALGWLGYFVVSNSSEKQPSVITKSHAKPEKKIAPALANRDPKGHRVGISQKKSQTDAKPLQADSTVVAEKPWYDDGKPGVSQAELASMHAYQKAMIEQNDPNEIVIAATADHPAVTRAELEALHAEQLRQIAAEANNADTPIIAPSGDQPVMTIGEVRALHAEQTHQAQVAANDPQTIAIEATDDHPAVTLGQLRALHASQRAELQNAAEQPAVAKNEDGSAMTPEELVKLHEQQRYESLKSEFDGDAVVIDEETTTP